ncbi:MAG: hypothetical protein IPJ98_05425 [Bryobacterales bacterium]|nr:hypothetical protein [Bryobacterales bacterium]
MKYFTHDLVAAANDWIKQTEEAHSRASERFNEAATHYQSALQVVRPRISKRAWDFFANGWGPNGLHDGRLLSLCVGDGLDYQADGQRPFRVNRQKFKARISFLNFEQDLLYHFDLQGLERMSGLLSRSEAPNGCVGDLFTYEITAVSETILQLAFLFESGATMEFDFRRLLFRKQRLNRRYGVGKGIAKRLDR